MAGMLWRITKNKWHYLAFGHFRRRRFTREPLHGKRYRWHVTRSWPARAHRSIFEPADPLTIASIPKAAYLILGLKSRRGRLAFTSERQPERRFSGISRTIVQLYLPEAVLERGVFKNESVPADNVEVIPRGQLRDCQRPCSECFQELLESRLGNPPPRRAPPKAANRAILWTSRPTILGV